MAADVKAVENLPDYPGSVTVKRLEGTLVGKRTKKSIPNHLADTSKSNKLVEFEYIFLQTCSTNLL